LFVDIFQFLDLYCLFIDNFHFLDLKAHLVSRTV
jgi:hypothetical protein